MDAIAWCLLALLLGTVAALAWPLGAWLAALCEGRLPRWMLCAEAGLVRIGGHGTALPMRWPRYALALILFNTLGALLVYALQRMQAWLPLNPTGLGAVSGDSAFNTAISFATNTNWQGYGGETTMSHLTQMLGLSVQNFLSAATGIAVAFALARGFAARGDGAVGEGVVGNFWVDLLRGTLWLLLPLSIVLALLLVGQGMVQELAAAHTVTTLEGASQSLATGPVASQAAIKMLGTNGGGFFNANAAHPFENPTATANALQMLAMLVLPAALCLAFGRVVGDRRQGWALLAAMAVLLVLAVMAVTAAEQAGNPAWAALGVDPSGGNMEGKELRFGIRASALFAAVTTAVSCGAVNALHDAFTPLGGMVPMVLMQLGEVVFGGVGSGLYGMVVFAILAVFIAGLMIGRTPEYLGKKIGVHEMKIVSIVVLATPMLVLVGTAVAVMTEAGRAGLGNPGAHGFSEVLYAFASAANNNGSAFAGLSANTPFYNVALGLAMWFGRFAVIVPVLALAGALAQRRRVPVTAGTLPTHGPLFVGLLIGTVVLVGLLNYVPALALGPVVEHLELRP